MANHCGLPATTRQQGPHPAFLHHCILHTYTAVIASAKCHGANIAQLLVHQIMQRESDAIAISMHSPFYLLAPIDKRIGNTAPKNRKKAPWFERKPCQSVSVPCCRSLSVSLLVPLLSLRRPIVFVIFLSKAARFRYCLSEGCSVSLLSARRLLGRPRPDRTSHFSLP